MKPNIFEFTHPSDYLQAYLEHLCQKNSVFSMRSLAKRMGFKSPSSLFHLLKKNRKVRAQHLPNIYSGLEMDFIEKEYFEALVYIHSATDQRIKEQYQRKLWDLKKVKDAGLNEYTSNNNLEKNLFELDASHLQEVMVLIHNLKSKLNELSSRGNSGQKFSITLPVISNNLSKAQMVEESYKENIKENLI